MSDPIICKNVAALVTAAESLLKQHADQRIFLFYGEMGVGKTTFIKAICKILGSNDNTSSPTYSIVNEYKIDETQESIYHMDFYRINKEQEAVDIGLDEYFYSGCYCFIEWPDKIINLLPPDALKIEMKNMDNTREITFLSA
ncbi:MAG: tRNA (adenosine(37)-N6)-threonylcarbamoyltransferase complex ATPase subunit type 1 TsaE [Bacteroidia bacterium]|nr:tRNA (adenosine(37)-N6)-threonylcarbamoyltransferase complex ATPase subunit type 1 TsaE [Bacteroidia bacterium]